MITRFMNNFRKPQGMIGRLTVGMMNLGHGSMTQEVIDHLGIKANDVILDIGCGGGAAIARMVARGAKVHGVDFSEVSVEQSRRKNRSAIQKGRVHVEQASVDDMTFDDAMFDTVTAFETIYFWENIQDNFKNIHRILKPGGRFVIAMEAYRINGKKVNYPKVFDRLQLNLYSAMELRILSETAGFTGFSTLKGRKGSWLCVCFTKPGSHATAAERDLPRHDT